MEATKAEGLLEMLQKCNANLEVVQKAQKPLVGVFFFLDFFSNSETGGRVVGSSCFFRDVFQSPGPRVFFFVFLGGFGGWFWWFLGQEKNKKWQ